MHPSIHDLLSVRDAQPVEARVVQHIDHCEYCKRRIHSLSRARGRLQNLPQFDAPAPTWTQIEQRMRSRSPVRRRAAAAAAASVATLAALISVALIEERSPQLAKSSSEVIPAPDPVSSDSGGAVANSGVEDLVAQSQELEALLNALPQRPLIERVSTAATIDTLEHRIQWLDYQLSYAPEETLSDAQSQRLWRERLDLMDSLVKVRYAEARRVSF